MRICLLVLTIVVAACSGSSEKSDVDDRHDAVLDAVGDPGPDTDAATPDAAPDAAIDAAIEVPAEVTPDVPADVPVDSTPDVPADVLADVPAELPADVATDVGGPDLPAETVADTTAETATDTASDTAIEGVGPWTQCTTDAECKAAVGEAGYCNLAFPGGQCQGCDPYALGTEKCGLLGHDGLTLTCREMAPTVCLFDCPCPAWLRCLESEQLCILKTCSADAECGPFVCRPISSGGTSYCLPAE